MSDKIACSNGNSWSRARTNFAFVPFTNATNTGLVFMRSGTYCPVIYGSNRITSKCRQPKINTHFRKTGDGSSETKVFGWTIAVEDSQSSQFITASCRNEENKGWQGYLATIIVWCIQRYAPHQGSVLGRSYWKATTGCSGKVVISTKYLYFKAVSNQKSNDWGSCAGIKWLQ